MIENSFCDKIDITHLEFSIRRFTNFYKLTNSYYKNNPERNFGVGFRQMLHFIEHSNPLIRNSARGWLSESSITLFRILDPLIERLILILKDSEIYFTESSLYIYVKPYKQISEIMNCFEQLRAILLTLKEIFVDYLST